MSSSSSSAFFYGTLMHPKILKTVIRHKGDELKICAALLPDYTRHKVKHASYPGIMPYSVTRAAFFDRELSADERSVRGVLVTGLSDTDVERLDYFEGTEYRRVKADIQTLAPLTPLRTYAEDHETTNGLPNTDPKHIPETVHCETYVYKRAADLEKELWSYAEFLEDSAERWYEDSPDEDEGGVGDEGDNFRAHPTY